MTKPRDDRFTGLLEAEEVGLAELQRACFHGIPDEMRAVCWQMLLGYMPLRKAARAAALERGRTQYQLFIKEVTTNPGEAEPPPPSSSASPLTLTASATTTTTVTTTPAEATAVTPAHAPTTSTACAHLPRPTRFVEDSVVGGKYRGLFSEGDGIGGGGATSPCTASCSSATSPPQALASATDGGGGGGMSSLFGSSGSLFVPSGGGLGPSLFSSGAGPLPLGATPSTTSLFATSNNGGGADDDAEPSASASSSLLPSVAARPTMEVGVVALEPTTLATQAEVADDPLSVVSGPAKSKWAEWHRDEELRHEIDKDIQRTSPGLEFFANPSNLAVMARILFVFAKLNAGVRYVQGMNELLAPIWYVMAQHAHATKGSRQDAEADTFHCFMGLMSEVRDVFIKEHDNSPTGVRGMLARFGACLSRREPEVASRLARLQVDHQFYAFRWLTTLLSREFLLPDVCMLWDSLFSDPHRFNFLLHTCVAMVRLQRDKVLAGDFGSVMKLLQSYPPVDFVVLHDTSMAVMEEEQAAEEGGLLGAVAGEAVSPRPPVAIATGGHPVSGVPSSPRSRAAHSGVGGPRTLVLGHMGAGDGMGGAGATPTPATNAHTIRYGGGGDGPGRARGSVASTTAASLVMTPGLGSSALSPGGTMPPVGSAGQHAALAGDAMWADAAVSVHGSAARPVSMSMGRPLSTAVGGASPTPHTLSAMIKTVTRGAFHTNTDLYADLPVGLVAGELRPLHHHGHTPSGSGTPGLQPRPTTSPNSLSRTAAVPAASVRSGPSPASRTDKPMASPTTPTTTLPPPNGGALNVEAPRPGAHAAAPFSTTDEVASTVTATPLGMAGGVEGGSTESED